MGILALSSFSMLWAVDLTPSPGRRSGMRYYGYSLPIPSNVLIIISGILAIIFSIGSLRLNVKVQGVGIALAGIALIPAIYSIVSLDPGLLPRMTYAPEEGFFLGVALCVALLTSASFFVVNWKFAPLPPLIALIVTLTSRIYAVEFIGSTTYEVCYGFPFQWFSYMESSIIKKSYFYFSERIFLLDLIIWLIITCLLLYAGLILFQNKTWKRVEQRVVGKIRGRLCITQNPIKIKLIIISQKNGTRQKTHPTPPPSILGLSHTHTQNPRATKMSK